MSVVGCSTSPLQSQPGSPSRLNPSQRRWKYIQASDGLPKLGEDTSKKVREKALIYATLGAILGVVFYLLGLVAFTCSWAAAFAGGRSGVAVACLQEGYTVLRELPHDFDDWSWAHYPQEMIVEQIEEFITDPQNLRQLEDVCCPLTGELFRNPLQIMTCRHIFEGAVLNKHIKENQGQCPEESCREQNIDETHLAVAHGTKIRVLCRLYQELGREAVVSSYPDQQKNRLSEIRDTLLRVARNAYRALENKYQEDIQNPSYSVRDVRETRRVHREQIGEDMLRLLLGSEDEEVDGRIECLRYLTMKTDATEI